MEIIINDSKYISEIQEEFQKSFPYLKIEFFKHKQDTVNSVAKPRPISGRMTLGMIRNSHIEAVLNIAGSRSVEDVQSDFQDKFGLYAEILRKSGRMWIETTLTHHWSLLRQNFEGQQMCYVS